MHSPPSGLLNDTQHKQNVRERCIYVCTGCAAELYTCALCIRCNSYVGGTRVNGTDRQWRAGAEWEEEQLCS